MAATPVVSLSEVLVLSVYTSLPFNLTSHCHLLKGAIRNFVRVHSWFIVSMPALLGLSTTLAGTALFIGIDREHGTPVSYIGLGGSVFGSAVLGLVTGRGWMCTYRSVTKAVLKRGERQMSWNNRYRLKQWNNALPVLVHHQPAVGR